MASEAETLRAMLNQEQLPPLAYPVTWNGRSIEAGTGNLGGEAPRTSSPSLLSSSSKGSTGMSLEDILNQIAESMSGQSQQIAGIEQQKAGMLRDTAAQQQEILQDRIGVNQAVNRAAMAAQDAGISARNALENNPEDPNSLMAMLTSDFVNYTKQAREQRDQIIQKKQVGLFDNPLEFLWNQITLPDEVNAMKATQSKADNAVQGIERMQQMTTAAAQAQKATAKTITEQTIAAQTKIDIADGMKAIQKINMDALGADVEGIKALQQSDAKKAEYMIAAKNSANQAAHLELSKRADMREQDRWDMIRKEKEQDEAAQDMLAKKASLGAAAAGQSNLTYEEIKFQRKLKGGGSVPDSRFAELVRRGEQIVEANMRGMSTPVGLGATPGQAIYSLRRTGGLDAPQFAPAKDMLNKILDDGILIAKEKHLKSDEEVRNFLSSYVDSRISGVDVNGKPRPERGEFYKLSENRDSPNNLLKAPSLKELSSIPGVQSNKAFFEAVIAPAVATNNVDSSVKNVLALGLTAEREGKISMEQLAAGIGDLYASANNALYATTLNKLSFPYQAKYIAEAPNPYGFFGSDKRNWADPANVLDYLVSAKRSQVIGAKGTVFGSGGFN